MEYQMEARQFELTEGDALQRLYERVRLDRQEPDVPVPVKEREGHWGMSACLLFLVAACIFSFNGVLIAGSIGFCTIWFLIVSRGFRNFMAVAAVYYVSFFFWRVLFALFPDFYILLLVILGVFALSIHYLIKQFTARA
jgi:hypothetical protein